jgi:putative endonuclease
MSSSPKHRKRLGAQGETIVRQHLERLGWRILAVNFRGARGEIDLVAEEGEGLGRTLVFLEVKTRRGARHGTPAEAVDTVKRRRLMAVANEFLEQYGAGGEEPACRFDVAEVRIDSRGLSQIELHRAVFGDGF